MVQTHRRTTYRYRRPRRFPKTQMKRMAARAAERLIELHAGDAYDPLTWMLVARSLGCYLEPFHEPGGQSGFYYPSDVLGSSVISFNLACSEVEQCLIIIHELGHHLIWDHQQTTLFHDEFPQRYDGDPGDISHQIARMVEEIIVKQIG